MTNEEAIEILKHEHDYAQLLSYVNEALKMAISALEKQIPKKPIEDGYYDEPAECPNCGENVINMADNDYHFQHCHYCGQALDWSDSDDR